MAQGYLWSSEFWFHVLFLAAFLGLSIIMIIVGIVDAWQESRPTQRALDSTCAICREPASAHHPEDGGHEPRLMQRKG